MDSYPLKNYNLPTEIPKESLINLLKCNRAPDSWLNWASNQIDREIALAILINPKTSQQHLENLFTSYDTFFGLDEQEAYYDNENKEYKDAWDILYNIEAHVNWEQKKFTNKWQEDLLERITSIKYPDLYYCNNLVKILDLDWDTWIKNAIDNSSSSSIYKKFFEQLRKLLLIPQKEKEEALFIQTNKSEIVLASTTKNVNDLEILLSKKDKDFQIKFAMLENPNLTQSLLEKILENVIKQKKCLNFLQDKKVNKIFSKYPQIANQFLERIAQKKDNKDNKWSFFLAECPHTPIHILEKYAQSFNTGLLSKLAANPHTPEAVLIKLARQNHYDINSGLRRNPNLPDNILAKLPAIEPSDWNKAYSDDTSVDELKRIALSSFDYRILIHVVWNQNTNIEVLKILAKDVDFEVRENVAKNPKTPLNIIEELAQDENEEVRYSVLDNPNFTKDDFYRLMRNIYGATNYSLGCLLALLDPNVSPDILENNSDSLLWNERYIVAIHPHTPKHTIQNLTKDGNVYVRAAALERC
ncbi:MAG: HEAT repeat domain-containing protein [Xenococcaceae cyanobacterium]